MEQTKNEPTKENKAAPETGKPKKEREPLTEAQRLKPVSYTHLKETKYQPPDKGPSTLLTAKNKNSL